MYILNTDVTEKPSVVHRLAVSITAPSETHLLLLTFSAQLENGPLKGFVFAANVCFPVKSQRSRHTARMKMAVTCTYIIFYTFLDSEIN